MNEELYTAIKHIQDLGQQARKFAFYSGCIGVLSCGFFVQNALAFYVDDTKLFRWLITFASLMQLGCIAINTRSFIRNLRRYKACQTQVKMMLDFVRMKCASASALEMQHDQIMAGFNHIIKL